MTEIIDEPSLYEVRRGGVVIAAAVMTDGGQWIGATTRPCMILRHASRDDAVRAIHQQIGADA